jgi:hypothetical protein
MAEEPRGGGEHVAQRLARLHVTLPATTLGFVEANIYARASGYVLKRYLDIGDHVKAGQLPPVIGKPLCTGSRIVTALVCYPFAARPPNNVVFASSARNERATRQTDLRTALSEPPRAGASCW